jgi:hypothetical protein
MAKLPSLAARGSVAADIAQGVGIKGPKIPLDSTVDGSRRKQIADALSQRGSNPSNKLAQYG